MPQEIARRTARRGRSAPAPTTRERFEKALAALAAHRIVYAFDQRGYPYSTSERYEVYAAVAENAGTDRWVGAHVGLEEDGGAAWDSAGTLRLPNGNALTKVEWSYNWDIDELPVILEQVFAAEGFTVRNYGGGSMVVVELPH